MHQPLDLVASDRPLHVFDRLEIGDNSCANGSIQRCKVKEAEDS